MSAARWGRLQARLEEAGITADVDERPYPGGVTRSIVIRSGDSIIQIDDQAWSKNLDIWIGWQVWIENIATSLVSRQYPITKKRGQVVRDVQDAIGRTTAATQRL